MLDLSELVKNIIYPSLFKLLSDVFMNVSAVTIFHVFIVLSSLSAVVGEYKCVVSSYGSGAGLSRRWYGPATYRIRLEVTTIEWI